MQFEMAQAIATIGEGYRLVELLNQLKVVPKDVWVNSLQYSHTLSYKLVYDTA